ncbi:hypothetical protein L1987_35965 [Smallanthus sonchifolius]|uniref:Uncharacterized protein n=1 Tax=Smallanthus sonchifolius TaxID=185202 RepID=A0ACB9HD31_9ASTR|nr:hypothetical protein L1987_35965 [Smallanthus sonchifolius]
MTDPMTFILKIDPFCNCDGCIHKVKKVFRKLDDVKLLEMNPGIGNFTISTTQHPEVIKYVLKQAFPNKNIIISQKMNRSYPMYVPPSVDDVAKALVTMSQVKGLESVEYTQSNVFKLNFINPHNQPSLVYHIPLEVLMVFTSNMLHTLYCHKLVSGRLLHLSQHLQVQIWFMGTL